MFGFRRMLPVVMALALAPIASYGKTVAECAVPDAMIQSFPGVIAGEKGVDWRYIAHGQSTLRLIKEKAGIDLVLVDSAGATYSVLAGKGELALTEGRGGGFMHVVVTNDGALDHFLFEERERGNGSLFWSAAAQAGGRAPVSISTVCQFL